MKALYESYGDYKFIFINHKDAKKFRVLKCPANIGKFHLDY